MASRFPRRWLDELFGNICLHCYIAEADQVTLPVLKTFPLALETIDPTTSATAASPTSSGSTSAWVPRTTPGTSAACTYWPSAFYDAEGAAPLHRLWDRFLVSGDGQEISDDELVTILGEEVHPVLGDAVVSWPS